MIILRSIIIIIIIIITIIIRRHHHHHHQQHHHHHHHHHNHHHHHDGGLRSRFANAFHELRIGLNCQSRSRTPVGPMLCGQSCVTGSCLGICRWAVAPLQVDHVGRSCQWQLDATSEQSLNHHHTTAGCMRCLRSLFTVPISKSRLIPIYFSG